MPTWAILSLSLAGLPLSAWLLDDAARGVAFGETEVMHLNTLSGWGPLLDLVLVAFNFCVLAVALTRLLEGRALPAALLSLLVWEVLARVAVAAHPSPFRLDPDLGVDLNPGYVGRLGGMYDVRVNALAARSGELVEDARKPLRVLVVGDSAVFGSGVDQDRIFSTRLEAALRDRCPDRAVSVMNVARPGTLSTVGLWMLRHRWAWYRPDVLIVAYNNDSIQPQVSPLPEPRGMAAVKRVAYQLAMYRLMVAAAVHDRIVSEGLPIWGRSNGTLVDSLTLFRENLAEMSRLEASWGGRLVFISMPRYAPRPELEHRASLKPAWRAAARDVVGKAGGSFLDLSGASPFPQDDATLFCGDHPDEVHPSAEGHERIAKALLELMSARVLSGRSQPSPR